MAVGAFIAATLDIAYAFEMAALRGSNPLRVLQSISSGIWGSAAYRGGWQTGAWGLALHYAITWVAAAVYHVGASVVPVARRRYLVAGGAFGVLVYLVMNFLVLPLSAVPFENASTAASVAQGLIAHVLLVGLPIAVSQQVLYFGKLAPQEAEGIGCKR